MPVEFQVTSASLAVVNRALEQVDSRLKAEGKTELRQLGTLVERDAETLARLRVRNITRQWAEMRVGQSPRVVYVVPQQRGTKVAARKRKNFAPLLLNRAMRPALERKRPEVYRRFNALVTKVCQEFNA